MPETKLLNQSGTAANQLCSGLRAQERCDGVGLADIRTFKSNRGEGECDERTVFPITRTGLFNFEKSKGGRRSTERMGHPKAYLHENE
jgi:hypothetical protein